MTDREVAEVVCALRGADAGSADVVIPIAYGLPRSVFLERAAVVRQRRAGVGLLVKLLRIARAERTAQLSAELLASLGPARPEVVVPWAPSVIKAEEPERYVRLMARHLDDAMLAEALAAHGASMDELLALAARVRGGGEAPAERDTPEQARARWVDRHAALDDLDDVLRDIDAMPDVDSIERQALHERAEAIGASADTSNRKVA